ncbi:hypothetical protein CDL15_Pgr011271 [Punica granatum]|uniref:DUF3511 domain-containing protein n=1 Tax=Punica granatum TaxID=22663 RepID=A0A218WE60_PUNGR|nr:hypothetical protein CDL15_Pgr011271 [Punica granatum]
MDHSRNKRIVPSAPPSSSWGFSDAEAKRRKRVVKYKAYAVEGRIKASIRSGFRWIKSKYSGFVHGC